MPRIENAGPEVEKFCEETGNGSSTFDICKRCFERFNGQPLTAARLTAYNGDPDGIIEGPIDGWAYDDPDVDPDQYKCEICGKQLTARDHGEF